MISVEGVEVRPDFLIRYLLSLHFQLEKKIISDDHIRTDREDPLDVSPVVDICREGLSGGHVVGDEGGGVWALGHCKRQFLRGITKQLFTINTNWPGRCGEGVVFQTGQRIVPFVEVVLEPVVRVASVTLVEDGLVVGGRVCGHPGEAELAGVRRGRGVNTVRPCNME